MKFFYSVIHTHYKQLFWRLFFIIKRYLYSRGFGPKIFRIRNIYQRHTTLVNDNLPQPIFQPRNGKVSFRQKYLEFDFLNDRRVFAIPIDWHRQDLNLGTRLWKLNLHYHEFLESASDLDFSRIIEDWIDNNSMYAKDYWKDSWNSYALSIRIVVWMQQYSVRRDSLSDDFKLKFLDSLRDQILFLVDNIENDIKGNHIIKNIKAILWGAVFFDDVKLNNRLQRLGLNLLDRELKTQILKDGMHFELSPSYHAQVLVDLLEIYTLNEFELSFKKLKDKIKSMYVALQCFVHSDMSLAQFNDGGNNMTYSFTEIRTVYQKFFKNVIEEPNYFKLSSSGYYGYSSRNESFVFKAGKICDDSLPVHGHGDIFSFEWSYRGQKIILDKGVYEYNAGKYRDESRATASHNTVSLDGLDQAQFYSAFRVGLRPKTKVLKSYLDNDQGLYITGRHDGYVQQGANSFHTRTVKFIHNNGLDIIDVLDNLNSNPRFNLLLHKSIKLEQIDANKCLMSFGDVQIVLSSEGKITIHNSRYFPDFGVQEECFCISIAISSKETRTKLSII